MASSNKINPNEELTDFLESLHIFFNQVQRLLMTNDPIFLDYCRNKLQNCISIVAAMLLAVNSYTSEQTQQTGQKSSSILLNNLIMGMEREMEKLKENSGSYRTGRNKYFG